MVGADDPPGMAGACNIVWGGHGGPKPPGWIIVYPFLRETHAEGIARRPCQASTAVEALLERSGVGSRTTGGGLSEPERPASTDRTLFWGPGPTFF